MRRLLLAELGRLRSRRLTWIALVLLLLALGTLQLAVYESVKPVTQSERNEAQQNYEQAKNDAAAEKDPADEQECLDQGGPAEACSPELSPEDFLRQPQPFADVAPSLTTTAVSLTGFALALVAASAIGAEFSTGALANWLTFVPHRGRVLTAKLLAVVLASAVMAAAALTFMVGTAVAVTRLSGAATTGADKTWALGARGVALAVVFAVLGFALALLTRHTVGAVVALVAYLLSSSVISYFIEVTPSLFWCKPLLPENNVLALLQAGYSFPRAGLTDMQAVDPPMQTITFGDSVLYWCVVLAAAAAVCFAVFRRRDVN